MSYQYAGVVTGIVKELDMEKACIKVEFPWLQDSYLSGWAPVAMPLSGKNRGMFFMPEIGDEVLVAFEKGNFEHPFVVGFLWNGVDKPPETTNKNRVIVTPGGHTLRFEDSDGAKKIIIESAGQHQMVLDDDGYSITVSDGTGSNQIIIDTQGGKIRIKSAQKIVVEASKIDLVQEGVTHPLVFGDALLAHLNQIATLFNTHLHPGEMAAGIFPVTPMIPTVQFPIVTDTQLNSSKVSTG